MRTLLRQVMSALLVALLAAAPAFSFAADQPPASDPPGKTQPPGDTSAPLSAEQLEQLLAPIALYPDSLLLEIVAIAREHGLIIYADEVYDKVLYDGATHTALGSLSEDVLTVSFNGLSKNYRSCGYRGNRRCDASLQADKSDSPQWTKSTA